MTPGVRSDPVVTMKNKGFFGPLQAPSRRGAFLISVSILLCVLAFTAIAFHARRSATVEALRTRAVLDEINRTLSLIKDAETGQRGYLLTGDRRFLAPYQGAQVALARSVNTLEELTRANVQEARALATVRALVRQKLDELAQTLALYEAGLKAQALDIVQSSRGQWLMEQIRAGLGSMLAQEEQAVLFNRAERARLDNSIIATVLCLGVLSVSLLWLMRALMARDLASLRLSEQRLATTIASIGDAVIATDASGKIERMNPVAEQLTGWTVQEALGQPLESVFRIINERTRQSVESPLVKVLRDGEPVALENHTLLIAKDGVERPIEDSGAPIRASDGSVAGVVLVFKDASERFGAERALQEADRKKDEFLATLAHELRNPMAPIRNAVRLLGPDMPAAAQAQARDILERQSTQMAHLLDDLLDVSRISRGVIELRREVIDLRQIVQDVLAAQRSVLDRLHHEISVRLGEEPLTVVADPTRMHQVIGNLVQNAAKYTDPGGRIEVAAYLRGNSVVLCVSDTGVGLAQDSLARVFDIFVQIPASDRGRAGLGIGLAVVKHIVGLHDGTVEVDSAGLGQGSRFTVTLPRATGSASPLSRPADRPAPAVGRNSPTVLLVDDHPDIVESLSLVLRASGFSVHTAEDGVVATQVAEALRPDLMIVDLGMPRMDGYEFARWLRQQPWGLHRRLIAVTGWGQTEDRHRTREAGFDDHVVKPVDPDALVRLLTAEESDFRRQGS